MKFSSVFVFWVIGFRARELFYYLKGGEVDYGEEHSKACGHPQFGRIYEQGFCSNSLCSLYVVDLLAICTIVLIIK